MTEDDPIQKPVSYSPKQAIPEKGITPNSQAPQWSQLCCSLHTAGGAIVLGLAIEPDRTAPGWGQALEATPVLPPSCLPAPFTPLHRGPASVPAQCPSLEKGVTKNIR